MGLLFSLDVGIRKGERGGLHPRDIDLSRRQVTVFGKGLEEPESSPLRGRIVLEIKRYMLEELPLVGTSAGAR